MFTYIVAKLNGATDPSDPKAKEYLCHAFALDDTHDALSVFCGVDSGWLQFAAVTSIPAQLVVMERVIRRQKRDDEVHAAGLPTAATKRAAAYVPLSL